MNQGEKLRNRKTMRALDRAKIQVPPWLPKQKLNKKRNWYDVTVFKAVRL